MLVDCWMLSSLVIPFLRLGEIISGGPHFPLTSDALRKVFTGQASRDVLLSIIHAVGSQNSNFAFLTSCDPCLCKNFVSADIASWVVKLQHWCGCLSSAVLRQDTSELPWMHIETSQIGWLTLWWMRAISAFLVLELYLVIQFWSSETNKKISSVC